MMSYARTYHRRQYLIDEKFQLAFIMKFCTIVILASLAIGLFIFFFTRSSTTVAIENTRVFVKPTADFILPQLVITIIVVSVVFSAILFAMALIATHRIAGPMYRLRKEIDNLRGGDLTSAFIIRDKDQLKGLARSLNDMGLVLRQKHTELKSKTDSLRSFLKDKNYCVAFEDKERFSALLKDIDDILVYFKV
ncbi:MAG: methyl-accepting chemotaxis protein [Candidatus Omnitrophica bacterium]|nr:methyl-accepting chemotaxis protein [Candidatus Omnitrophota bacterium]